MEFWAFPRNGLLAGTRLGAQTAARREGSSRYGIQADAAASNLTGGDYVLQVLAIDKAGNRTWSVPEYVSIVVDTSAAATGADLGPTLRSVGPPTDGHHVAVTFSRPLDAASVAADAFSISPGLAVTRAVLQPGGVTVMLETARQAPATDYTVIVSTASPTLRDAAGNAMRAPNAGTFRGFGNPDTTPPVTSISASPPAPDGVDGWFVTPPTVTLTAVDPGGFPEDPVTIQYLWSTSHTAPPADDADFPGPPYTFTAPTGANTLYYRAIDSAGNREGWNSLTFKVDSSVEAPVILTPLGPEGSPKVLSGTFDVAAKASDTNSGIAKVGFWAYRRGAAGYEPWGTQIGPELTAPLAGATDTYGTTWNTLAAVLDGTFRIEAEMTDRAGNAPQRSAPQYVILDNTAPVAKLTAPQAGDFVRGTVAVEGDGHGRQSRPVGLGDEAAALRRLRQAGRRGHRGGRGDSLHLGHHVRPCRRPVRAPAVGRGCGLLPDDGHGHAAHGGQHSSRRLGGHGGIGDHGGRTALRTGRSRLRDPGRLHHPRPGRDGGQADSGRSDRAPDHRSAGRRPVLPGHGGRVGDRPGR